MNNPPKFWIQKIPCYTRVDIGLIGAQDVWSLDYKDFKKAFPKTGLQDLIAYKLYYLRVNIGGLIP